MNIRRTGSATTWVRSWICNVTCAKAKTSRPNSSAPDSQTITNSTDGAMMAKVGSNRMTVRALSVDWLRIVLGRVMFTSRLVRVR